MALEWQSRRIRDVGKVVTGKTPSTKVSENFGGPYPFITIPDMDGRREINSSERSLSETGAAALRTSKLPPRAVMMSCIATIGRCGITTRPSFTNQQINSLICGPEADPSFVYYSFSQLGQALEAAGGGGSVYTNVSKSRFEDIEIKLPPLGEQKAIARVLGTLDDKIELNRRMNATLEAMARALFQSWFVDFDPVHANAADLLPSGMDESTAILFPSSFQDSELGEIPKGWSIERLDGVADITMGLSPAGDSYNTTGIGTALINGPVEFGEYFPVKSKWTEAATRFSATGDLIFCVRGSTTGRRVVSDGTYGIGRGVCAIRAKHGFRSFLYQTVNTGLDRLLEKTTGSVFPSLSAPDIKGFSVIKPKRDILEAFERVTRPLIERIELNQHQSHTLATLRDTLLPKLLCGELSVTGNTLTK